MKIGVSDNVVERSGLDNETEFKIKASGKAFKILSDGLYSNKIGAVIRELSCNAYDSHVAAGISDVPFEVHLPNSLECWFSVKDFGVGLSHDDVIHLYSTYFESTKNNSNDFVGAFGLGSKSPFSYVDSFTVISRFAGKKRIYTSYITETGVPTISLLHTEDTEEKNGIEVQVPVKEHDIRVFRIDAQHFLQFFNPRPVINIPEFEFNEITPIKEGKDWKYYGKQEYYSREDSFKIRAIQGHVPYNVDSSSFGTISISPGAKFVLNNLKVEVFFEIGQLEVAASREALSYNKQTSKNIVDKLEEVYNDIKEMFWKKKESFDGTEWERCIFNYELEQEDPVIFDHFKSSVSNISGFDKHISFDLTKFEDVTFLWKGVGSTRCVERSKKDGNIMRLSPSEKIKIYVSDKNEVPPITWFQHSFESQQLSWKQTQALIIKASPKFTVQQILDGLGNPEAIPTSSLAKPPRKPRLSSPPQFVTTGLNKSGYRSSITNYAEDELPESGFYMPSVHGRVIHNEKKFTNWSQCIDVAIDNDWIDESVHDKIFVLTKKQIREVSDNKNWINLFEFLTNKLKECMEQNAELYFKYNQVNYDRLSWQVVKMYDMLKANKSFKKIKGTIITEAIEIFEDYKKANIESEMKSIAEMFGVAIDTSKVNLPKLSECLSKIYKRYPLLKSLSFTYGDDDISDSIIEYIELIETKLTNTKK